MPKHSRDNVKEDIKRIVDELKLNAKDSLNNLAEKLNFSRQKIWRIITKLEKEKKIWGYTTVVDDKAFGYQQYFILIKRSNVPASEKILEIITSREVKNKLSEIDISIVGSYYVHGEYDWVIIVNAKDIQQVKNTVEIFYKKLRNFISKVNILEVLFPLEKCGIENPSSEDIQEFF